MAVFTPDPIEPRQTDRGEHVAFRPTDELPPLETVGKLQMIPEHYLSCRGAQRDDCHLVPIAPVPAYDYNGPDLDHLRDFVPPEVTDQDTALPGLIVK